MRFCLSFNSLVFLVSGFCYCDLGTEDIGWCRGGCDCDFAVEDIFYLFLFPVLLYIGCFIFFLIYFSFLLMLLDLIIT